MLLAAGAGTPPLAAQVGIYTPATLCHHVRFSFPVRAGRSGPCWIDKPADEPGTYQHQSGPGQWSLGGYVDPALTAWERGPDAAAEASRAAALSYARERLTVEPRVVDSLYCTHVPDLGDGYTVAAQRVRASRCTARTCSSWPRCSATSWPPPCSRG